MTRLLCFILFLFSGLAAANAQERAWVQIEAHNTLREAQDRARTYAAEFPDVNGFRMVGGWYAIALGPFTPEGALNRLANLINTGRVPGDSYVSDGRGYGQQFWPVAARGTTAPVPPLPAETPAVTTTATPDETPAEARRSEARLSREERMALQEALQWGGYYSSAIDGAFGRGTRASMAAWQQDRGYEPTGVLTTRQRVTLLRDYQKELARLGMRRIDENRTGISIEIPTAMVTFDRYDAPFAHFQSAGDDDVRVLLISQSGDQNTLFGLYDIMQTLDIVPLEGERERGRTSFVLTGQNDKLHSYTYAELRDGAVKGFTLVWPPRDAKLMNRAAQMMRASFQPIEGVVLPDTATDPAAEQSLDLLSGLDIRRPTISRSGFFVSEDGAVLTTREVVQQCRKITIGEEFEARLLAEDATLGVALLAPQERLSPIAHAAFQPGQPRLRSDVAVAGFSYEGALDMPVLTYGTLADLRGLSGETTLQRLALAPLPGDAGGPVFDSTGAVMGVLLARSDGTRKLPQDVSFAANVPALAEFLSANGIPMSASEDTAPIAPEDLALRAADMTVLVSCWN